MKSPKKSVCLCLIIICEVDKVWLIFCSIFQRILSQNVPDYLISQFLFGSMWEHDELWNKVKTWCLLQFYIPVVYIIHTFLVNAVWFKVKNAEEICRIEGWRWEEEWIGNKGRENIWHPHFCFLNPVPWSSPPSSLTKPTSLPSGSNEGKMVLWHASFTNCSSSNIWNLQAASPPSFCQLLLCFDTIWLHQINNTLYISTSLHSSNPLGSQIHQQQTQLIFISNLVRLITWSI